MVVGFSNADAARDMLAHLVARGHRTIGFIGAPRAGNPQAVDRRRAYDAAVKKFELARAKTLAVECPSDIAAGGDALDRIVARHPDVTAIFAASEVRAIGALLRCQRRGLAVPERRRHRRLQRRAARRVPGAGAHDRARSAARDRTPRRADDRRPPGGPRIAVARGRPGLRDRGARERMKSRRAERWLALAPAAALFLGVALLPMAELVAMSVSQIQWREAQAHWSFAGAANYVRLARDGLFRAGVVEHGRIRARRRDAADDPRLRARAFDHARRLRGRVFYRTVFILPILVPGIVIGAIWKLMYSFDFGVLNQILGVLGVGARRLAWQHRRSALARGDRRRRLALDAVRASCCCWRASKACRRTSTKRRKRRRRERSCRSCATSRCR